jgi:hypothetical protein
MGCGVGMGYGFGAGLMLKPGVVERWSVATTQRVHSLAHTLVQVSSPPPVRRAPFHHVIHFVLVKRTAVLSLWL